MNAMVTIADNAAVDPMIVMEAVDKYYGAFHALKSINLTVKQGEKVVLCGPSGSGKSTLIRCINYLENFASGRVVVDGIELKTGASIDAIRREVGMITATLGRSSGGPIIQISAWSSTAFIRCRARSTSTRSARSRRRRSSSSSLPTRR